MPAWSSSPLMLDHGTVRSVCPQPSITQPVVVPGLLVSDSVQNHQMLHDEGSPSAVSTDAIGCNVCHHFDSHVELALPFSLIIQEIIHVYISLPSSGILALLSLSYFLLLLSQTVLVLIS